MAHTYTNPDFANRKTRLDKILELEVEGVIFIDKENTYIEQDVEIGEGTTIYPFVVIYHSTRIGKNCLVWPFSIVTNSRIGDHCEIRAYSRIVSSRVAHHCVIGPSCDIHDNSVINPCAELAHCEVVRSFIGTRVKAKHWCYIGDARVGRDSNIGAGTVFCNYDGQHKNQTIIEPCVFVGSGTMLVPSFSAPLCIGRESIIAAGSVVTKNVPQRTLVIARGQKHAHIVNSKTVAGWDFSAEEANGEIHKVGYAKKTKVGWKWGAPRKKALC